MADTKNLIERDLQHLWHPCSQMSDYHKYPPLVVESAEGPYLIAAGGRKIIDGISSWWCKSLGHRHPHIRAAVERQLDCFEHIIMANTTSEVLVRLGEKLAAVCPGLDKVFYADNGSTAVEISLKMSLQYHLQTGHGERTKFASLQNDYHGETILALAVSNCDFFSSPFRPVLPETVKIPMSAYCAGEDDPAWKTYPEAAWRQIEKTLEPVADTLAAIIVEPIIQGCGGMMIYSPDLLRRLRAWTAAHGVHLVADEIMTGFGRCGKMMACEYAGIQPDFACFSKSMTAGWGPMSAVVTSTPVYDAFYGDYFSGKAFVHSNTYTGYPVTAAAALAAMEVYEQEKILETMPERSRQLRDRMRRVAEQTGALVNVRGLGFIATADLIDPATGKPFDRQRRTGFQCYWEALQLGALLRPLGDTLYFLPPLNCPDEVLDRLADIAAQAVLRSLRAPAEA